MDGGVTGTSVEGNFVKQVFGFKINGQAREEQAIATSSGEGRSIPVRYLQNCAASVRADIAESQNAGVTQSEVDGRSGGQGKRANVVSGSAASDARWLGVAAGIKGAAVERDACARADVTSVSR